MKKRTFVSLFSGCGGLDLGFEQAGFLGKLSIELATDACTTFANNNKSFIVNGDVRNIQSYALPMQREIDVLIAGPPCQGFSLIGSRNSTDPRNSLLLIPIIWAKALLPKVIVIENVYSASEIQGKEIWMKATKKLRDLGYHCKTYVVNAKEYGVPQNRLRSILLASKREIINENIVKTHANQTNLLDVFRSTKDYENHAPVLFKKTSRDGIIASRIDQGQKLCDVRLGDTSIHSWDIPEVFGSTNVIEKSILNAISKLRRQDRSRNFGDGDPVELDRICKFINVSKKESLRAIRNLRDINYIYEKTPRKWELKRTFNGKYRRLSLDSISNCVLTKFGRPTDYLHPLENRGISVREAARIQGFPDTFKFSGSLQSQWTQVGNAVPVPLAHSIAMTVKEIIE